MDSRVPPSSPGSQPGGQPPIIGISPCAGSENHPEPKNNNVSPHCYNLPSPPSPRGALANNTSLKSELDQIRLRDYRLNTQAPEEEDDIDPDNINLASLMAKMRQIRSSGQIQYRVAKKRKQGSEFPSKEKVEGGMRVDCAAELSDEHELVTVYRQKRVKKSLKGPRSTPHDREKRHRKSHKDGKSFASQQVPLTTPPEAPILPESTCELPPLPDIPEPQR